MKIYVDELPKSCSDCPLRKVYKETDAWGNEHIYYECNVGGSQLAGNCPLQYLAEHDKQVRKEVCEEVKTELLDFSHEYWRVFNQNGKQYMTDDDIEEKLDIILDKVQGKNNG